MRTRRSTGRSARVTAAAATLVLLLAACGSDAPEEPEQAVEEPEPVQEPDPEPEPVEEPEEVPGPDVDGDCSAAGASIEAPELTDVPDEVVAARDFLLDAALRCDEQLLFTAIEESDMFTYSFAEDGDAIGYWWDLEEAGDEPFLHLARVLATTPGLADGGNIYVFPQVTTGLDEHTTPQAWAELDWLTDAELEAQQQSGIGYLHWRAGISADGQWRFFVIGD